MYVRMYSIWRADGRMAARQQSMVANECIVVLFNPRPIELQLLKPRSIKTLVVAQLKATSLLLIINY